MLVIRFKSCQESVEWIPVGEALPIESIGDHNGLDGAISRERFSVSMEGAQTVEIQYSNGHQWLTCSAMFHVKHPRYQCENFVHGRLVFLSDPVLRSRKPSPSIMRGVHDESNS